MAVDTAAQGLNLQTQNLVSNLARIQEGGALALDEKGALIGEGVKNTFRGKIADFLVSHGLAEKGSIGGRIATALVGKPVFDLLSQARHDPKNYEKSVVLKALDVLENIQKDAAGADFMRREAVGDTLRSTLSARTPLSELIRSGHAEGGRIHEVSDAIAKVQEEQRASRQERIDLVRNGEPTEKITAAYPDELRRAHSVISEEGRLMAGESPMDQRTALSVNFMMTAGRAEKAEQRALDIMDEFNRAVALIRGETPPGEDASARVDAFKAQYLSVLASEFERRDVADGQRLRADGQGSTPINEEGRIGPVRVHFGGSNNGGEELRTYSRWDAPAAESPAFERAAFPGERMQPPEGPIANAAELMETVREFQDDAFEVRNFTQLDGFAKDLRKIAEAKGGDPAHKAEAAHLALDLLGKMASAPPRDAEDLAERTAINDSHKGMAECLRAVQSQASESPALIDQLRALEAEVRSAAEADIARTKAIIANPENHPALFEAHADGISMQVYRPDSREGDALETANVRKSGRELDPRQSALTELKDVQNDANAVLRQLDRILR